MRTPDPRWKGLYAVARRQAGAFHTRQAQEFAIGRTELTRLSSRAQLRRLHPEVYCSPAAPDTPRLAEWAALLRLGGEATLSHLSAGAYFGWWEPPAVPELTVPSNHRDPGDDTVRVLRSRHAYGVPTTDGRRVTLPARAIVDNAQRLPRDGLAACLLTALQRRQCGVGDVLGQLDLVGRPYAGSAMCREVVREFTPEMESILGAEAFRLLRPHIPELQLGQTVRRGDGRKVICDLAVPALKWDIEADGWAFHGSKSQQQRDRRRDRALSAVGWETTRFTTDDIRRDPAATVRDALAIYAVLRRRYTR
jgi:hypothetical protein